MLDLPARLIDWSCELEARDTSRNIARAYRISATEDLFGHWIVNLSWGRIGNARAQLTVSFESDVAARRFIDRTLARRATLPKRLGVAYRTTAIYDHTASDEASRQEITPA